MSAIPYDERLERLLTAAARVFAEKGYHATTMRDVARASGMSLAGMYYYFRGKDELLYLIQERCFTSVLRGAQIAVAASADPVERLRAFIEHHTAFFARHMSEMKVLSHEADSLSKSRIAGINSLKRRYVKLLIGLIDAVDSGDGERHDSRVAAYALFGMMNWIYNWYDPSGPVPPARLADRFAKLFLSGLNPSPTPLSHGG